MDSVTRRSPSLNICQVSGRNALGCGPAAVKPQLDARHHDPQSCMINGEVVVGKLLFWASCFCVVA
jgi:hypothetical protein